MIPFTISVLALLTVVPLSVMTVLARLVSEPTVPLTLTLGVGVLSVPCVHRPARSGQ